MIVNPDGWLDNIVDFGFVMKVVYFIRPFNKVLNFLAFWKNEVLLNTLFYSFHLFIYKLVISWQDVTLSNLPLSV